MVILVSFMFCENQADRVKTPTHGDISDILHQRDTGASSRLSTATLRNPCPTTTTLGNTLARAARNGHQHAFQAATAAINSVNPTILSTRRRL